jgi:hypothetical protein
MSIHHEAAMLRFISFTLTSLVLFIVVSNGKSARLIQKEEASSKPGIAISHVPQRGAGPEGMRTIAGTVSGVGTRRVRVVLFARTNTWYVQPYAASPYTAIGTDGKWQTQTHLGDEYAALLVEATYKPPAMTDTLPEVDGPVLAIATVAANTKGEESAWLPTQSSSANNTRSRTIRFSGYTWKVKDRKDIEIIISKFEFSRSWPAINEAARSGDDSNRR